MDELQLHDLQNIEAVHVVQRMKRCGPISRNTCGGCAAERKTGYSRRADCSEYAR